MNFQPLQEISTDKLILKKISEEHRQFISDLFQDPDIRKYYIVPKEAQQDYRQLVNYWFLDISKGAGYAWVIYKKGTGLFSGDKPCGFFAFEFRDSLKNARISYALAPKYRKQGIITSIAEIIIDKLKELGIQTIEADIDKDNVNSEKIIQKLGFVTDKRSAMIDPEMMRDGDIRFRYLWRKDLFDYSSLEFYVVREDDFSKLFAPDTNFRVWEEEVSDGPSFGFMNSFRKPTGRYHFLFQGNTTEAVVGLSSNTTSTYNVPWELVREEIAGTKRFMVFTGWGDAISGGNQQFEGHEIGISSNIIYNIILNLKKHNPNRFSDNTIKNIIGLEKFQI
ncbi:GNAT family N-acetyltransferase [Ferruginibacter sp. SUN002]|uniref:GNAT family N-acetyltransferase n=1 Tax=Ferruginibacter sp. SUN002 TaxID=2937789 RepID=UPI003D3681F6